MSCVLGSGNSAVAIQAGAIYPHSGRRRALTYASGVVCVMIYDAAQLRLVPRQVTAAVEKERKTKEQKKKKKKITGKEVE